ncbi:hypothetical protein [Streptomyces sp. NPDC051286]|uniref:hypothetical protein n=1 Tax=Streptomyces sp. NPDC051286 TaxID=3365647 RepID=UPI0037B31CDA
MIDTEMHATAGDPDRAAAAAASIPLGRPGIAPEIASTIARLLSGEASYVTGGGRSRAGGSEARRVRVYHLALANPRPHAPTTTIPRAGAAQFIDSSLGCRSYGPVPPPLRG